MYRKLILLVNDALELNIEVQASLLDEDLFELEGRVEAEQAMVQAELDALQHDIDTVFGRLHRRETWADSRTFGQALAQLVTHFGRMRKMLVRQAKLEVLDEAIEREKDRRKEHAVDISQAEATVLELTHSTICSYSRDSAA